MEGALQKVPEKNEDEGPFDWNDYLKKTRSVKAPRPAFFQPHEAPENPFKEGQLILAKDKHAHLMVLSKIRHVYKCWIYIHIEGLDETHCRWVICDDRDISPVGPRNDKLKIDHRNAYPPTGLKSNFKKWIVQQYKEQEHNIAPDDSFRPIDLKFQPKGNMFQVGMKLAAYDEKSFDGKLSPATIVDVGKVNLKINFDGWPSSYDISVPFYSRCLFPIDLVESSGLAINIPRVIVTHEPVKTHKDLHVKRGRHSPTPPSSSAEENDEHDPDGPPQKKKRLGFFDAANKPMRPGQRAAAMKEQVTGVKAKVIDILREATEAQEREEIRDRQHPPKLVPVFQHKNLTFDTSSNNSPMRTIAPKPMVVYQGVDTVVVRDLSKQPSTSTQSPYQANMRSNVQQVRSSDGRVVTITRPKTVMTTTFEVPKATCVTTSAGDLILADPTIKSALRQTLDGKDEQSRKDSDEPSTSSLATARRVMPPQSNSDFIVADPNIRSVMKTMHDSSLLSAPSSSSSLQAKRAVPFRSSVHQSMHPADPHPLKRMDGVGSSSTVQAPRMSHPGMPNVVTAVRPSVGQHGSLMQRKRVVVSRPIAQSVMTSMVRESMPVLHQAVPTPMGSQLMNARRALPTPLYSQSPAAANHQQSRDVPLPCAAEVKVEEYHLETKTVQKVPEDAIAMWYVNKECKTGPMLNPKKVRQLRDYTPLPYPAQLARVIQDIIYCAWVPRDVFDQIKNIRSDFPSLKVTVMNGKEFLTKNIPIHLSATTALMYLRDFFTAINCCTNLISPSEFACESCAAEDERDDTTDPSAAKRVPKYRREYDVLKKLGARLCNTEEISNEYRKRMGDDIAEMILENQIDSAVLPYCQEDLLREQMKLPYNTALRMAAVACELRAAAFESVPGIENMDLELK